MKVGIQLYSVRNHMEKDPLDTIRQVTEAGYRYIEVANHNAEIDHGVGFDVTAQEITKILKETDSKIISAHIFPMDVRKIEAVLEYHKVIGTKFLVMPMDFYKDRAEILAKAEILNQVGAKCKEYGMELLYHNHYHEYQVLEGEIIFDTILDNTDPELVKMELDTYWAMRGGQDPVVVLKKLGKRIRLIHQKDYPKNMEADMNLIDIVNKKNSYVNMDFFERSVSKEDFTEIGTGIMDIQSIIDAGNKYCDVDYIILEQDFSKNDEMESIKISMNELQKYKGIEL